jgi:hypothetical protein
MASELDAAGSVRIGTFLKLQPMSFSRRGRVGSDMGVKAIKNYTCGEVQSRQKNA